MDYDGPNRKEKQWVNIPTPEQNKENEKQRIKHWLKKNPDVMNEIITELRREKIQKLQSK